MLRRLLGLLRTISRIIVGIQVWEMPKCRNLFKRIFDLRIEGNNSNWLELSELICLDFIY